MENNDKNYGLILLEKMYNQAKIGIPGFLPTSKLAEEYRKKYNDPLIAAKKLVDTQVLKCTTSGFITNVGGLITLPFSVPANITSVLYVQIQMLGALAVLGGYDLNDDEVETMVYMTLSGMTVKEAIKTAGVKTTQKITANIVSKIPGTALTKINRAIGFRFITRAGQKGIINLGKLTPFIGGFIGGGFDYLSTKKIGKYGIERFVLKDEELL